MGSTICLTLWSKVEIKLKKLNELETSITAATSRTLPSIISWNAEIDLASRPSTTSLSINLMMHECGKCGVAYVEVDAAIGEILVHVGWPRLRQPKQTWSNKTTNTFFLLHFPNLIYKNNILVSK